MKNHQKKGLKIALALALTAIAVLAGYFSIFHHADVLTVTDGKIKGAKPTWLISHRGDGYFKLADVGTPKGYAPVKDAQDQDGDPLTTAFRFAPKGETPGEDGLCSAQIDAFPVPAPANGEGGEPLTLGGKTGLFRLLPGENAAQFLMDSPYGDTSICIQATLKESADRESLVALLSLMAEKIAPGKQPSPFAADFKLNFLDDARWKYLWNGLGVTLEITSLAVLMGIVIGILVATVRSTWEQTGASMRRGGGRLLLRLLNGLCKIYLTVIRGTPVVIQLMIMYYIIFATSRNGVLIAVLAFGINSGAYVAEIIRGGIMSIDKGQMEAGRSLGFNYVETMRHIIIPQAMKNVLPALANEFIVLLKETSVAGYVAVKDLTKGGDIIRGVTYSAFMPLLAVAAIYLMLVMFFTWLVGKLERRLRSSDH